MQATQLNDDKDIQMADREEDVEEANDANALLGEEEIEVQTMETPTQRNLPLTITIKRRHLEKKLQKPQDETTQTQAYFDVTIMEEIWVNEAKKGKPIQQNQLWTCKLCGLEFSSTNKDHYSNTSRLNTHLCNEHNMNKQKHFLGVLPK